MRKHYDLSRMKGQEVNHPDHRVVGFEIFGSFTLRGKFDDSVEHGIVCCCLTTFPVGKTCANKIRPGEKVNRDVIECVQGME